MNNQTEGIVLRQNEYKDHDAILSILSKEYGWMSFLAKGLRKNASKNASGCMPYTKSIFHFDERKSEMQLLKFCERRQFRQHIYESIDKQIIAECLCEMSLKSEGDDPVFFYEALDQSLNALNEDNNPYCVLGLWMAKMNAHFGIEAQVDECIRCGNQSRIYGISIFDGGFVCKDCFQEGDLHVEPSLLRSFRLFHKASFADYECLSSIKLYSYEDVEPLIQFFNEYGGLKIKSFGLLKKNAQIK